MTHIAVFRGTTLFFVQIVLFLQACSVHPQAGHASWELSASGNADHRCIPEFKFQDSWWGADAAYSIPLPDGRGFWTFGDTLYGESRAMERMVRNSIGISSCNGGKWRINYVLRRTPTGEPVDFFQTHDHKYWYWALDGFVSGKSLYVMLMRICRKLKTEGEPYGFETCGADVARLSDLDRENPQNWGVEYRPLVGGELHAYPSASAIVDGQYAYIFTLYEKPTMRPLLLTRISLEHLDSPQESLEYYARNGQWKTGFVPDDAAVVMDAGMSELSVRFHRELNSWVALLFAPKTPGTILIRTAPQITGPWTEGEALYRVPELEGEMREKHPDRFCYAAKEHVEFSRPNSILFTYVCNSTVPKTLLTEYEIYVPIVVESPMPKTQ